MSWLKSLIIGGIAILLFNTFNTKADISPDNLKKLNSYQDTLKRLSDSILLSKRYATRQGSCFVFIKTLVNALKVDGSFEYPFDSLKRVMILKPDDNKFRIFNWYLYLNDSTFRYYGTIQMNNPAKLELFPFWDYSEKITHLDTVTSHEKWYGALYYKLIKKDKYYYLFGWRGDGMKSGKKLIDVMWFNKENKPMFGAPKFCPIDGNKKQTVNRFFIEFKKTAAVTMNYDNELQMIVYDHLTPPDEKSKGFYFTYVPDGTYEGFKYEGGKWVHVNQVFTSTMKEPIFPVPVDFEKEKNQKKKN